MCLLLFGIFTRILHVRGWLLRRVREYITLPLRFTRVGCQLPKFLFVWQTKGSFLLKKSAIFLLSLIMSSLFRELVEQGYKGSYASVRDNLLCLLPQGRKTSDAPELPTPALPPAREASFLFILRPLDLEVEEQEMLTQLRLLHPEVDLAYELVQQFARMLRTRTGEKLDTRARPGS